MFEVVRRLGIAALAACVLAACSGNGSSGAAVDDSGARGSLIQNPPFRAASLTAADLTAQLQSTPAGQQLLLVAGMPTCGVDVHYIQYGTVGGAGESTTASGVLMVPTGAASCTGKRPIVLYAHGTTTDRTYNLAAIADTTNAANGEAALVAAMFAAQGYIVVAPNYAGYDSSPLPYHPYLNADQQSKEMIDALTAARKAIGNVFASGTSDSGKLFVTGYSQGGHVAMATVRAMQGLTTPITVTASAPMSGPYAMEAMGDAIFFGSVNIGATVFTPLITTSFQKAYGNVYNATTDVYEATYATGIDTLLPSTTPLDQLFVENKLPQTALFSSTTPVTGNATLDAALAVPSNPLFATGFGASNLVLNSVRVAWALDALASPDGAVPTPQPGVPVAVAPQYGLRKDFKTNDLRNSAWFPTAPMLLCGGNADPTVFFSVNAQTMQAFWAGLPPGAVTVLDVDSAVTGPTDPFAAAKAGFAQAKAAVAAAGGQTAVVEEYHGTLVPPFCTAAARGFFGQFLP
ncbi:MAG TPA: prolyl oligopeptidase family serine peptidase [Burkholderiaceae bacterium]|nr:prolyl oligopeptidase family serine peptidase [Burkholderiaceae bacterium]